MRDTFNAFLVTKDDDNQFARRVVEQSIDNLPEGDVLIRVHYSSLNYKDALLQNGVTPSSGEILVTGSTGGVGSLAVSILSKLGYCVVATTGKSSHHDFLKSLGAVSIVSREEIKDESGKPLLKERWAGAVDTVGGNTLATAIKSTKYGGCVTACGLVGGTDLATTVYPFILRGVRLIGIDSVQFPLEKRSRIWQKLAFDWKPTHLDRLASTVNLLGLSEQIDTILQGRSVGRVLVKLI